MHAPANPGNLPWNWERRREAVLNKPGTQDVPSWVQPFGYAAHHEPIEDDGSRVRRRIKDKQAADVPTELWDVSTELALLIDTQDRDLAPVSSELVENFIPAFSIDEAIEIDEDDSGTRADMLTYPPEKPREKPRLSVTQMLAWLQYAIDMVAIVAENEDMMPPEPPPIKEPPNRRELWLMEQDRQRWYTGPVIRCNLTVAENGNILLQPDRNNPLNAEQTKSWLLSIAASIELPKAQDILNAKAECMLRQQFYGRNWQLSLLTPNELRALHTAKTVYEALNEEEEDIQHDQQLSEEQLLQYNKDRWRVGFHNCYAGGTGRDLGLKFNEADEPHPECQCATGVAIWEVDDNIDNEPLPFTMSPF